MELDHYQIVRESIGGDRTIDEQTFASLAILSERLENVKRLDHAFYDVSFSPVVKKLTRQNFNKVLY